MSRARRILQGAAAASRLAPLPLAVPVAEKVAAAVGPRLMADKAAMLRRHLTRALPPSDAPRAGDLVADGFGSYGRYWVETFSLPTLSPQAIDRGFSFVGFEKIQAARAAGTGAIIVLPHLGGWEWAAAWLGRVADVPVAAVVEPLEPDDVFEWFRDLRESYGVEVIAQGTGAVFDLLASVRRGDVVCLVADRDLARTSPAVPFFGEETPLPLGPALLARRCRAPLLPTAVFFDGRKRLCVIDDPIHVDGLTPERATRKVADGLERLIRRAPDQWHLLEANWPSDPGPWATGP